MDDSVSGRPTLVTADGELSDDVLHLAAAAGVAVRVVPDIATAYAGWGVANRVLLGPDACAAAVMAGLAAGPLVGVVDRAPTTVSPASLEALDARLFLLPADQGELVEWLVAAPAARPAASVLGVVGGRGGAGASTLACALAVTAARAARPVCLLDADPLGGGLDLALGGEGVAGLRWPDLAGLQGPVAGGTLRDALPLVNGVRVLGHGRGDRPADVPAEVMSAVLAAIGATHDLVVADLPRAPSPAAEEILRTARRVLMVVTADVRAVAAAGQVAGLVRRLTRDLRLVVRGPAPSGLSAGVIADHLGLPLAGAVRAEPDLPRAVDCGLPPAGTGRGPLAMLARAVLDDLGQAASRADRGDPDQAARLPTVA